MRALLFLALLLSSCAPKAQPRRAPYGFMQCAEDSAGAMRPIAFIRLDVLGSEEGAQVLAHETVHLKVARSFRTCKEYDAHMAEGDNHKYNEALAFCASAHVWSQQSGVTLAAAIEKYAGWLSRGYPQFNLTPEQAVSLISERCS